MQPESFPPGFLAAPYGRRFIQSQSLFCLPDFLLPRLQISRLNCHLPNLRSLSITEAQFPFLLAQFECNIQNSRVILFSQGDLVFHFFHLKSFGFNFSRLPSRPSYSGPLHRIYSIRVIRAIRGSDLTYGISLAGLDGRSVCRYVTDLGSSSTESQQFRSSSPQVLHRSE